MVSLKDVETANASIGATFPPEIVAVFVGATSGIGESTLLQFAKYTTTLRPRVYFVGRSQEAGDRLVETCKKLNSNGQFSFIQADTSLIRNVDEICREIAKKEKYINILCMSSGTLLFNTKTSEGLHMAVSLVTYSRNRFANNLLPLLSAAPKDSLRRVVTVFAAGHEGAIDTNNIQCLGLSMMNQRAPTSSIVTLSLEQLSKKAPTVSFIHSFPSFVTTGIGRDLKLKGPMKWGMQGMMAVAGFFLEMPIQQSGDRHLFLATSARYPGKEGGKGVEFVDGVARGTDGRVGSGVYSVNQLGESSGPKVERLLAEFRKNGVADKVWKNMEDEWERITTSVEG